jgi:hypothetical protein
MHTPLQSSEFTTTDGLQIHIVEYGNRNLYEITDQQNNRYYAAIINNHNIQVNLQFKYDNMENDGYTIYSNEQRKTKHLGKIIASQFFDNIQNAERAIIDAARKIAKLTPMFIVALNEIENISMRIKTAPKNSDNDIPYLIQMMQVQLDYLKIKFPQP